jgi:pyruvate formate lyase activating enzyme
MEIDCNDMPKIYGTTPIADIGYPRKSMPALFVAGCNFRCPYCINNSLVVGPLPDAIEASAPISKYFISREPWIMITGAEPLMNPKTPNLMANIKALGMKVALATNGSFPDRLEEVYRAYLVDYVAMDIKTGLDAASYSHVSGVGVDEELMSKIMRSIDYLKKWDNVDGFRCEFRMTACRKFVDKEIAMSVARHLGIPCTFVLQMYTIHQTMDEAMARGEYVIPYEELVSWVEDLDPLVGKAMVREV